MSSTDELTWLTKFYILWRKLAETRYVVSKVFKGLFTGKGQKGPTASVYNILIIRCISNPFNASFLFAKQQSEK